VGQPSLGNLIFAGLQTETWVLVLVGCVGAAALALIADGLLGLIESGLAARKPVLIGAGVALLVLAVGAAMASAIAPARPVVTIGAKNFSEQYILARLIGARLERAGYAVRYKEGLGSAVAFTALSGGDVDVYVDYAGTLWANQMGRRDVIPHQAMIGAIGRWMAAGPKTGLVGPLGFENAYALAMRGADARRLGIATIADLARAAPQMQMASDLEFLDRPEWAAIRDAYGLRFAGMRSYAPSFMYRALTGGQADVISAFSSDGRIAADRLAVLADPKGAAPGYDALLLVSPQRAGDGRFLAALRPLVGAIAVDRMRAANYMVDRDGDKATPEQAARWLAAGLKDRGSR
jgi:osmoprotectant transport system permease protein